MSNQDYYQNQGGYPQHPQASYGPPQGGPPQGQYGPPQGQGQYYGPPQGQQPMQYQQAPPQQQKGNGGGGNCLTACLAALCCCCVCEETCECWYVFLSILAHCILAEPQSSAARIVGASSAPRWRPTLSPATLRFACHSTPPFADTPLVSNAASVSAKTPSLKTIATTPTPNA
ncbi:hypothetical protein BKA56DRAFT_609881 [Ilyonectria sp. MPI-CAGE-AT-0026]|nr:hypothetical protein BKA56DRAFT_609881 [Ilyonectria sp. MPI-CAGE-AT-0026]